MSSNELVITVVAFVVAIPLIVVLINEAVL